MAMVLKTKPTARVVVPVTIPNEDEPVELTATWKLLSYDEAVKAEQTLTPDQIVEKYLQDLEGIENEDGSARKFDGAARLDAMQVTYVRSALLQSFFMAQNGRAQYAAKN